MKNEMPTATPLVRTRVVVCFINRLRVKRDVRVQFINRLFFQAKRADFVVADFFLHLIFHHALHVGAELIVGVVKNRLLFHRRVGKWGEAKYAVILFLAHVIFQSIQRRASRRDAELQAALVGYAGFDEATLVVHGDMLFFVAAIGREFVLQSHKKAEGQRCKQGTKQECPGAHPGEVFALYDEPKFVHRKSLKFEVREFEVGL